jgi:negative modulator of initiation of replication
MLIRTETGKQLKKMKSIEIEDELYAFIASQTERIGEDASQILHRLLLGEAPIPKSVQSDPVLAHLADEQQAEIKAPESLSTEADEQSNVFDILDRDPLDYENSRVQQWLHVLSALHQANPSTFNKVLEISGRNRFAADKSQLLEAGSSTNPKSIPNSQYWVVTNNNTAKKLSMLSQVCELLGYSDSETAQLVEKLAS